MSHHPAMARLAAAVFAVILPGCHSPLPDRSLKEYVSEKDVTGVWTLTAASLALLARDGFNVKGHPEYRIDFRDDHTCRFRSVIDGAAGNVYHDVSGRWTLERDSTSGSNLTRKNVLAITLIEPEMTISTSMDFDREEGKLVLWSFLGDPDSWEFMEYTQDPAEKSDKPPTEIK